MKATEMLKLARVNQSSELNKLTLVELKVLAKELIDIAYKSKDKEGKGLSPKFKSLASDRYLNSMRSAP